MPNTDHGAAVRHGATGNCSNGNVSFLVIEDALDVRATVCLVQQANIVTSNSPIGTSVNK